MLRLLGHTLSAAIKARSKRTKIEQQRSTAPSNRNVLYQKTAQIDCSVWAVKFIRDLGNYTLPLSSALFSIGLKYQPLKMSEGLLLPLSLPISSVFNAPS